LLSQAEVICTDSWYRERDRYRADDD